MDNLHEAQTLCPPILDKGDTMALLQRALDICINEGFKEYDKRKKKIERMKKFINIEMLKKNKVYFCTFTFKNVDDFERKKFVQWLNRSVKLKCRLYADYGEKNDRFHLHGFCSTNRIIINGKNGKYGNIEHEKLSEYGFTKFVLLNDLSLEEKNKIIYYTISYSIKNDNTFRCISCTPRLCL